MESFPRRERPRAPFLLSQAAELLGATTSGSHDPSLRGIATLDDAGGEDLSFLAHRRYLPGLPSSRAGAILLAEELEPRLPEGEDRPRIVVTDAHEALGRLLDWLHPKREPEPGIHPTAVLGPGVVLGRDVCIAPYAVIEAGAEVGDGTWIGAHTVVGAETRIGAGCLLHPHVVVYPGSVLGKGVILHAGVRVGVDGFGYVFADGEHRKVPQVGGCRLEDGVEVGANTTFDRGSIGETRIGAGTKVDNLVQIGHNASIGERSILVSQVGVAGSTRFGVGVVAGGQAGITGHVRIGDGAQLAAQSGIVGDVPAGETYMGFPARPRQEFLRTAAGQRKVPEALRRLRSLEREVASLRETIAARD